MGHGGSRKGAGRPVGQGQYGEQTKPIRLPISLIDSVIKFVKNKGYQLPLYRSKVSAGTPFPADDAIEKQLDLNEHLIKHPLTTFLVRASGNSMIEAGIYPDDILVVELNSMPTVGKIVVAVIDGQLTVKRFHKENETVFFLPENKELNPIEIREGSEIYIWGIVTHVIHAV